jgi:fermentation-respiration switch protein FrsA (DUF1100 family)
VAGTGNFVRMHYLPATFLVLLAAYLGLCLFYWFFQERFIFIRFHIPRRYRFRFRYPFEERWVTAPDGASLHALYFKSREPRGVVIYFHGNTGTLRRWCKRAPTFTAQGFDVLMPDPRGYGKSKGRTSEEALIADAKLWYAHAREHWPDARIVLYGRSLGSALAVPLATRESPAVLLLETPFANLYEVARNYLPILPYRLLLRYPFRNDRAIRRVRCPVYIFHGKRDSLVPHASALRLYAAIPADVPREMFTFPKGEHGDLARFARFKREVRRLLHQAVPPDAPTLSRSAS